MVGTIRAVPEACGKPAGNRPADPEFVPAGSGRGAAAEAFGQVAAPGGDGPGLFVCSRARRPRGSAGAGRDWVVAVSQAGAMVPEIRLAIVDRSVVGLQHGNLFTVQVDLS